MENKFVKHHEDEKTAKSRLGKHKGCQTCLFRWYSSWIIKREMKRRSIKYDIYELSITSKP